MAPHSELAESDRLEIIVLHKEGYSVRQITKKVRVPKSTVEETIQRWKETGSVRDRARVGRPVKITSKVRRRIDRYLKKHDEAVPKEVIRDLKLNLSSSSINKVRRSLGYQKGQGKPLIQLSDKDKEIRRK